MTTNVLLYKVMTLTWNLTPLQPSPLPSPFSSSCEVLVPPLLLAGSVCHCIISQGAPAGLPGVDNTGQASDRPLRNKPGSCSSLFTLTLSLSLRPLNCCPASVANCKYSHSHLPIILHTDTLPHPDLQVYKCTLLLCLACILCDIVWPGDVTCSHRSLSVQQYIAVTGSG